MIRFAIVLCICHACPTIGSAQDSGTALASKAVVRHGATPVVEYRAFYHEGYLIIESKHSKGWHTYALDNEQRAQKALNGKQSLGIEQGTVIELNDSVKTAGPWLQTKPKDFSKPELRWYTYGYDGIAHFARKIKQPKENLEVKIRGQACSGETCCRIVVELVPVGERIDEKRRKQLKQVIESLVIPIPAEATR